MRIFVHQTGDSVATASLSQKSASVEIIQETELLHKTTVYWIELSSIKVDQVGEDDDARAWSNKSVKAPNRSRTRDTGTRYKEQKNLSHIRLGHVVLLGIVRKILKDGLWPQTPEIGLRSFPEEKVPKWFWRISDPDRTDWCSSLRHQRKILTISDVGHKHFLTIVKEQPRIVFACSMRSRSKSSVVVSHYVKSFEKQLGYMVTANYAENGTGLSSVFTLLTRDGLICTKSIADTPNFRERSERTHEPTMNNARFCFGQEYLPKRLKHYALQYSAGLRCQWWDSRSSSHCPLAATYRLTTDNRNHAW